MKKKLHGKNIQGSEVEKEIIQYISNILSIDALESDDGYKSPIIKKLLENEKESLVKLAQSNIKSHSIPYEILNAHESIDIRKQYRAYSLLRSNAVQLPSSINYEICLSVLEKLYDLYGWEKTEKIKKNSLRYYAVLMNSWINGSSLQNMISNSIKYYSEHKRTIYTYTDKSGHTFNRSNKDDVNVLINKLVSDIEQMLRFKFQKYFRGFLKNPKKARCEPVFFHWSDIEECGVIELLQTTHPKPQYVAILS